jgi:DNA mismatch repair ATPase MutS
MNDSFKMEDQFPSVVSLQVQLESLKQRRMKLDKDLRATQQKQKTNEHFKLRQGFAGWNKYVQKHFDIVINQEFLHHLEESQQILEMGRALEAQFDQYKRGKELECMTPEQVWMFKYKKAKAFYDEHGHSNVTLKMDSHLYYWMRHMRNKPNNVSDTKKYLLDIIAFKWKEA